MSEERFLELAAKYLSKEASNEERASLYNYLEQDEYYNLFTHLKNEWEKARAAKPETEFNIESGFEKLTQKIQMEEPSFSFDQKKNQPKRKLLFNPALLKYAASIAFFIVLVTGTLYISGVFKQKPAVIAWNEKHTIMGEKYLATLSDGSTITLNADSKLKYPTHFTNGTRDIYLEGEAYFEVKHDSSKPFIVHSGNISTTVLGTKFNVSAFPNEKNIAVSLVEGSVKVSKEEAGAVENIVMLQPDQQLVYNKEREIGTVEQFDLQEATGWKENKLVFRKEPFANVLVKLERIYGVKFELQDKSFRNQKITANFQNESLWTVSESLRKLTGLQYKTIKENNVTKKIIFFKK
ncbi:MAG: FecR domain-containing protein [Ignavibacteriales bacterium]|nr:FecR domain-containing protein [Ignavibacteriales bacterium]